MDKEQGRLSLEAAVVYRVGQATGSSKQVIIGIRFIEIGLLFSSLKYILLQLGLEIRSWVFHEVGVLSLCISAHIH